MVVSFVQVMITDAFSVYPRHFPGRNSLHYTSVQSVESDYILVQSFFTAKYILVCVLEVLLLSYYTFDVSMCTELFSKFFSSFNPLKSFQMPKWIPALNPPSIPYDLSPPTHQQVTKMIGRIKASGSPCPLDKISIIPFKHYPYLRYFIAEVIRIMWLFGEIPKEWKKARTILIHKKGETPEPANCRPITLESVPLKILTSCLRDSMFAFLSKN